MVRLYWASIVVDGPSLQSKHNDAPDPIFVKAIIKSIQQTRQLFGNHNGNRTFKGVHN